MNLIDYRNPAAIAAILRVNKQINSEAMAVIFKKYYLILFSLACYSPLLECRPHSSATSSEYPLGR